MRTPMIPLTLLSLVLIGCTDDVPTAPSSGGSGAAARAAANGKALPFHGTLKAATHTSLYDPETNTVLIHLVGTGTANHLGRFTLVSDLVLDPATLTGPEQMTLTAANGDMLFATGTGQGIPSADGLTLSSVESMTITGGTGRFAGATGSFILRQVNLGTDLISSGSFTGTIALGKRHH
ncbi:MAG: hypothetical protein WKG32_16455 [Gemmatimonadaceae bacterium]